MSEASMSREDAEHIFGTDNVERLREENEIMKRALQRIVMHGLKRKMYTEEGWEKFLKMTDGIPNMWRECAEFIGVIAFEALEEVKK